MPLTEEQRAQVEANRQRALQRRAAAQERDRVQAEVASAQQVENSFCSK